MRGILFTSILAAGAILARPAAAQSGTFTGTIGGGLTLPTGRAGDQNKTGGHGTITLGYRPLNANHIWSIEAGFSQLEQITKPVDSLGKVHSNIMMFMGRYDHYFSPNVYVTGAFGMVRDEFRERVGYIVLTNTDSHAGLAGGVGVTVAKHVFLEGRVIYAPFASEAKSNTLIPITVGIRF